MSKSNSRYEQVDESRRIGLIRLIYDQGSTIKDAVLLLGINYNTARSVTQKYKYSGSIIQSKKGSSERSVLTNETKSRIEDIISHNLAYTLKEIKAKIENERSGFQISIFMGISWT